MTPLEIFEAEVDKHWSAIFSDFKIEAIVAISKAIAAFHRELRQNSNKASGIPTGKAHVATMVWKLLKICLGFNIAPPAELVEAVEVCLDIDERVPRTSLHGRDWDKYSMLTAYFADNPDANKRQAHRDTGLSRETIRKYTAGKFWDENVAAERVLQEQSLKSGVDHRELFGYPKWPINKN